MKQNSLYIFIGGFVAGILFRSFVNLGFSFSIFLIALSGAIFLATLREARRVSIAFFILAAGFGVLRFDIADLNKGNIVLDEVVRQEIIAEGILVDEPDERENHTKLIILLDTILVPTKSAVEDKIIVTADIHPRFSYGDKLRIKGELKKPKNFAGDDGQIFDYVSFLEKDDIFYQIFYPELELVSSGNGNVLKHTLFAFKKSFLEKVSRVIPDPQVSLLGGLVVGAKQSLGEKLQDDFRKTGIIHIVVLSGYNVTIVAEAIMRFFSFLPYVFGVLIGAIAIIFFAIMTGASATIVRASMMALLVLAARASARKYLITRALFLAGFLMLLHNPKILVFDSSFQLSFMATIGLIYLAPKIEKHFHLMPTKWQLREFAVATVATQIFVLPMILYKMGMLSLVALPVNLLILMFIPLTMLLGFLTGMIGFASTLLSFPFAFITNALLMYQLKVVDIFASLPFSAIEIDYFPLWAAVFVYIIYGLFILKLNKPDSLQ
jgi:competence protein ComEC|tara:strand:+ start:12856 stop:14334 length:1479 start_codon:yes stop_codon:yes gene_type:complete